MPICPFYRVEQARIERRKTARDATLQPLPAVPAAWCAHLYSPVSKYLATHVADGPNRLRCGGDLDKCEIGRRKP